MANPSAESGIEIRPSRSVRTFGVVLGLVGILYGLSGFAAGADIDGGLLAGACGCLILLVGFGVLRAKTWVEQDRLVSRFVRTTRVPAIQIRALCVDTHGRGSNIYIRVDRLDRRRPTWAAATGRVDTRRNRAFLEQEIRALRAALHLAG